jgi:membrane protease subunit (stomatin/prohibitin family)
MGLIKAIIEGAKTTLADQWLEYIYCEDMTQDVLMRKGQKRTRAGSSNTKGSDNIITQGSHIAVNEGQFLLIVDDGKVVDFTDDAGNYTYDKSTEPSMLYGGFGKGLLASFNKVGQRFTFGGDTGHDQRVYFINKKLITDNKFGTKAPIPFRDSEWNITINITCFGTYVYKIMDPLLFYANLAGNVDYEYHRDAIQDQFKSDLCSSLLPALSQVATQHVSYDMLPGAVTELTTAVQTSLKTDWEDKVGINVDRIKIESVSPTQADAAKIQKLQETRVYGNDQFAGAARQQAQVGYVTGLGQGAAKGGTGSGMEGAVGMMGAAMMGNMMGNMGMGNPFGQAGNAAQSNGVQNGAVPAQGGWQCSCGAANTGKFCLECGKPKPDDKGTQAAATPTNTQWTCECGTVNTGKFCQDCGKPKPVVKRYKCGKCGWAPQDPTKPPKFCPECGDVFNDNDVQ